MALVLTYPLARWHIVIGKFLGQSAILAIATPSVTARGAGCRPATQKNRLQLGGVATLHQNDGHHPAARCRLPRIGYVLSALAKQRGSAAGMAIGVWLFFVLLYDFALLGALIADKGQHISANILNALLLANPTDTYRLYNLSGNVASALAHKTASPAAYCLPPCCCGSPPRWASVSCCSGGKRCNTNLGEIIWECRCNQPGIHKKHAAIFVEKPAP